MIKLDQPIIALVAITAAEYHPTGVRVRDLQVSIEDLLASKWRKPRGG